MCFTLDYVLTCSLCMVFLCQACGPCIDLLMYFSCFYIFLVVCVLLSVVEFVYYRKYGIVCVSVCVIHVEVIPANFINFYIFPKYLNVCPSFLSYGKISHYKISRNNLHIDTHNPIFQIIHEPYDR
jgi:hypothetical protein